MSHTTKTTHPIIFVACPCRPTHSEIRYFDEVFSHDENVARGEISMNEMLRLQVIHTLVHLNKTKTKMIDWLIGNYIMKNLVGSIQILHLTSISLSAFKLQRNSP